MTQHPLTVARREKNLTREGLAFKSGVSLRTIERLERGANPQRSTARVIADVLECDPFDIWPALAEVA